MPPLRLLRIRGTSQEVEGEFSSAFVGRGRQRTGFVVPAAVIALGFTLVVLGFLELESRVRFNRSATLATGQVRSVSKDRFLFFEHRCVVQVEVPQTGERVAHSFVMDHSNCGALSGRLLSVSYIADEPSSAIVGLKRSYAGWPPTSVAGGLVILIVGLGILLELADRANFKFYRLVEVGCQVPLVGMATIGFTAAIINLQNSIEFNSKAVRSTTETLVLEQSVFRGEYGDSYYCIKYISVPEASVNVVMDTGENARRCFSSPTWVSFDPAEPRSLVAGRGLSMLPRITVAVASGLAAFVLGLMFFLSTVAGPLFADQRGPTEPVR